MRGRKKRFEFRVCEWQGGVERLLPLYENAKILKTTKGKLAKRSSFLERKGGPSAEADGG